MAEFKLNDKHFSARRMEKPFVCKVDGMNLQGCGMDWVITRDDGQSFPMPDHIFKMLFEPVDEEARKLFTANYNLRIGFSEGLSVADTVEQFVGSLFKKSRKNVPDSKD